MTETDWNEKADIVEDRRCGIARGRPAAIKKARGSSPDRGEREVGKGATNGRHPFPRYETEGIAGWPDRIVSKRTASYLIRDYL